MRVSDAGRLAPRGTSRGSGGEGSTGGSQLCTLGSRAKCSSAANHAAASPLDLRAHGSGDSTIMIGLGGGDGHWVQLGRGRESHERGCSAARASAWGRMSAAEHRRCFNDRLADNGPNQKTWTNPNQTEPALDPSSQWVRVGARGAKVHGPEHDRGRELRARSELRGGAQLARVHALREDEPALRAPRDVPRGPAEMYSCIISNNWSCIDA